MKLDNVFTHFATAVSRITGRAGTFIVCIGLIVLWAATGPLFGFSDTWQLIVNTSTTIITFLMVFLIQNTQNRDNAALQAKLDELIFVSNAKNEMIGIEKLTDRELEMILQDLEAKGDATIGERSAAISAKAKEVHASREKPPPAAARKSPAGKPATRKTPAKRKSA